MYIFRFPKNSATQAMRQSLATIIAYNRLFSEFPESLLFGRKWHMRSLDCRIAKSEHGKDKSGHYSAAIRIHSTSLDSFDSSFQGLHNGVFARLQSAMVREKSAMELGKSPNYAFCTDVLCSISANKAIQSKSSESISSPFHCLRSPVIRIFSKNRSKLELELGAQKSAHGIPCPESMIYEITPPTERLRAQARRQSLATINAYNRLFLEFPGSLLFERNLHP